MQVWAYMIRCNSSVQMLPLSVQVWPHRWELFYYVPAKRESDLLARIGELDDEKAEAVAAMSLPENYSDGARMRALQAQADEIEAATARLSAEWEETAAESHAPWPRSRFWPPRAWTSASPILS